MALWRSSSSWCWWACWSRRSVAPALTALAGICRGRALAWRSPLQIDPQGCPPLWNLGPPRLTMSPYTLSRLKFFPDFFAHQIRGCARVRGGRILPRSTGASRCAGSAAPAFCPRPCRKCVFVPPRLPCGTQPRPAFGRRSRHVPSHTAGDDGRVEACDPHPVPLAAVHYACRRCCVA